MLDDFEKRSASISDFACLFTFLTPNFISYAFHIWLKKVSDCMKMEIIFLANGVPLVGSVDIQSWKWFSFQLKAQITPIGFTDKLV